MFMLMFCFVSFLLSTVCIIIIIIIIIVFCFGFHKSKMYVLTYLINKTCIILTPSNAGTIEESICVLNKTVVANCTCRYSGYLVNC